VRSASALRQRFTRLIVSTSAVLGYLVLLHDVDQAYRQSKDELTRTIYLRLRPEDAALFEINGDQVLKVVLALYSFSDAGDYWYVPVIKQAEGDLGLCPLTGDPSLYVRPSEASVNGRMGKYVDDFLHGSNEGFHDLTLKRRKVFEAKPQEWDCVEFFGVCVKALPGPPCSFTFSQDKYVEDAIKQPLDIDIETFVSVRSGFACLAHRRPDLCCATNRSAQVTTPSFCVRHVQELNKAIKHAKATARLNLRYIPLDWDTRHLRAYAEACFAKNEDLVSQLGLVVVLCDGRDRCHVLAFPDRRFA